MSSRRSQKRARLASDGGAKKKQATNKSSKDGSNESDTTEDDEPPKKRRKPAAPSGRKGGTKTKAKGKNGSAPTHMDADDHELYEGPDLYCDEDEDMMRGYVDDGDDYGLDGIGPHGERVATGGSKASHVIDVEDSD